MVGKSRVGFSNGWKNGGGRKSGKFESLGLTGGGWVGDNAGVVRMGPPLRRAGMDGKDILIFAFLQKKPNSGNLSNFP